MEDYAITNKRLTWFMTFLTAVPRVFKEPGIILKDTKL